MWFLPLQGNRIAWCVGGPDPHQLLQSTDDSASQTSQGSGSHNSGSRGSHYSSSGHGRDWCPETIVEICEDVRNFKCPYGGSVMDLIEATPKGMVSKVLLEEKMYRTWYHGRIVLVGDSCHKVKYLFCLFLSHVWCLFVVFLCCLFVGEEGCHGAYPVFINNHARLLTPFLFIC